MFKNVFVKISLSFLLFIGCTVETIDLLEESSIEIKPKKLHVLLDLSGRIFYKEDTVYVNDLELIGKIFYNLLNDEHGYNIHEGQLIKSKNFYYPRLDPYAGSTPHNSVWEVVVAPLNYNGGYFSIVTPVGRDHYQYLNSKSDTLNESLRKSFLGVNDYLENIYTKEKSDKGLNIWDELEEYLGNLDTIHHHKIIVFTDGFVFYEGANIELWSRGNVEKIKKNNDKYDVYKREINRVNKNVKIDFLFAETGGYDHVDGVIYSDGSDQNSVLKKLWQNYLSDYDNNISWYMKWRDPRDEDIKAFLFD